MPARIIKPDQWSLAVECLTAGGLVAMPTDTVYGVFGIADADLDCARLREFKGGRKEPFSLHVESPEAALGFLADLDELSQRAVRELTGRHVTVIVAQPARSVGIRVVGDEHCSRVLTEVARPVVASSANHHGRATLNAPTKIATLDGVDLVLDGGSIAEGAASTVVRVRSWGLEILRHGAMSDQELRDRVTRRVEFVCLGNINRSAFAEALLARVNELNEQYLDTFVPFWAPTSSGLIGHLQGGSPPGMLRAADAFGCRDYLAARTPRRFDGQSGADMYISMGNDVAETVAEAKGEVRAWQVTDPMGGKDDLYVHTTRQVAQLLTGGLKAETALNEELEKELDRLFQGEVS